VHGTVLAFTKGISNPKNVELTIKMPNATEVERLQKAIITTGGTGDLPSDELMYEPIRYCLVTDPFGTEIIIISTFSKRGQGSRYWGFS